MGEIGDMVESTVPEMTAAAGNIRKRASTFEKEFGGVLAGDGNIYKRSTDLMDDLGDTIAPEVAPPPGPSKGMLFFWGELGFLANSIRVQTGDVGGSGVIGFFGTAAKGIRSYATAAEAIAQQYKSHEIDSEKQLLAVDKVLAGQFGMKIEKYGDYYGVADLHPAQDTSKNTPVQGDDPGKTDWDGLTFEQIVWMLGSANWDAIADSARRLEALSGDLSAAKNAFWGEVGSLAEIGGDGPIWKGAGSQVFATQAERTYDSMNAWVTPLLERSKALYKVAVVVMAAQDDANEISTKLEEDLGKQHAIINGMRFAGSALWSWWNGLGPNGQTDVARVQYNTQKNEIEGKANDAAAEITRLKKEALEKVKKLGKDASEKVHAAAPWKMPGEYSGLLLEDTGNPGNPNLPTAGGGAPNLGGGGGGGGGGGAGGGGAPKVSAPKVPGGGAKNNAKNPVTKPTLPTDRTTTPTGNNGNGNNGNGNNGNGNNGNGNNGGNPTTTPPNIPDVPGTGNGGNTGGGNTGGGNPGTGGGTTPVVTPPVIPGTGGTGTGGTGTGGSGSGNGGVVVPSVPTLPGSGTNPGGGGGNGSTPVVTPPQIPGTGTGGTGTNPGGAGTNPGGNPGTVPILPGGGTGTTPGGGSSWGNQPWTPDPITPGVSLDGRNGLGGSAGGLGGSSGGGPLAGTPVTPIRPGVEGAGLTTSAIGGGGGDPNSQMYPPMMPPMGGAGMGGMGGGGGGGPKTTRRGGPKLVDSQGPAGKSVLSGRTKKRRAPEPTVEIEQMTDPWLADQTPEIETTTPAVSPDTGPASPTTRRQSSL
ncbi:uncharacterized protein YukE [Hamadaea flava]|uniref:ESX-1 secretion-associated protein EspA/EspE-like domain-containing protein n=1 Tax=Hamadaea flava TaxID=1742688 RepID=A0ABV8LME6_9ACTN|nr:hypothetical protein [Hamadaea flava]MCP2323893.1 uncharacterized protein YukE [Hamadaea flava]